MTLEQLQKIAQLDKLKADGILTSEEYDKARERLLVSPQTTQPAPPLTTNAPGKQKVSGPKAFLVASIGILALISLINIFSKNKDSDKTLTDSYTTEQRMRDDSISTANANENKLNEKERAATKARAIATVKKLRPLMRYQKDDFNGGWFYGKSSPRYTNANGIYAYFNYKDDAAGPSNVRFVVQHYAEDWLFVQRYRFLIDGKEFVFIPEEVKRDSGDGGMIWEWFDEQADSQALDIINAIINSKSAKVRLEGKDYRADKTITPAQRADFKRVMDLFNALLVIHTY